ncbi:6760_t:CDS:2, partial [Cetraspora pellucida]
AFSTAGRIIDEYRSNLTSETVEMLVALETYIQTDIPIGTELLNKVVYYFTRQ